MCLVCARYQWKKEMRDTLENRMLAKLGRGPFHNNNNIM
jgi:hypothetical protein